MVLISCVWGCWCLEELATEAEVSLSVAISEEAVVTDMDEVVGPGVEEEAAEEFFCLEGHGALAVMGVVLVAEGDLAVFEGQQSVVGDGHAVSVAGEVFEYAEGVGEGGFGVDDPFFLGATME
jgi:hypothetical protein